VRNLQWTNFSAELLGAWDMERERFTREIIRLQALYTCAEERVFAETDIF